MTRHNNHILDLHIAMPKQRMSIVLHVKISGPFMQHKGRVCMRMTRQIALGYVTILRTYVAIFVQVKQLSNFVPYVRTYLICVASSLAKMACQCRGGVVRDQVGKNVKRI